MSRRGTRQTQSKNGCRRGRDCCFHRSVFLPRPAVKLIGTLHQH
ncbi:hypothetical protein HMPREF0591_6439 [Mycobacterium parascrofulaceum ATCC BAA-614]|uniref:Uncharacterized protein n=1 Tax=Mycobacterium parascrofulaceum ATCC BAA-614 TaxID=525368 RepID=D5PJU5_9MYCO|nr:hypothetical protein HMPREF0591_6439 [Mycobacterium parascrofulaceum ATCC BAA-614]